VLATDTRGHGSRIALVHGFGQDARCWGPLADDLARDHQVIAIDAPGHGRSRAHRGTIEESAEALSAIGPAIWIGYSMGGRMALQLAIDRPDLVQKLVLIGATAGIEDPIARAARRKEDEALAETLEREGTQRFFDAWLARPMFAALPDAYRFREEREAQDPHALAEMLRRAGTGAMTPLWDRLGVLSMPVLALAGERDARFAREAERIGPSKLIAGAGHAAHLEAPDATIAAIRSFLGPA